MPAAARPICASAQKPFDSYVAQVAEMSVNQYGSVRLERIVAAVDVGIAVNPDGIGFRQNGRPSGRPSRMQAPGRQSNDGRDRDHPLTLGAGQPVAAAIRRAGGRAATTTKRPGATAARGRQQEETR